MRERWSWLRRALLVLLALPALVAHASIDVVDDRGVAVHLAQPPRRIVSLLPSLTESVCVLGACERLAGVDDYSDWPASVRRLPHLGGLDDAHIEAIVALHPDLVLAHPSSRALSRLRALGLPVLALEPKTLPDVQRVLRTLGSVLGTRSADAVWTGITRDLQAVAARTQAQRGTRVYVEVGGGPYAASASSFIGDLLTRLGAVDIVPASLGTFPRINPEFVVRADPQLVIVARSDAAALRRRPGWAHIAALRAGRVCALDAQQATILTRPGPRVAEAAAVLAHCLQLPAAGSTR